MRFCANASILYNELPLLERFEALRRSGFTAIELWWPRDEQLDAVRAAIQDARLDVALVNFDGGDLAAGERGLLSNPDEVASFHEHVAVALEFGRSIGCSSYNALVGLRDPRQTQAEQLELARTSVQAAADAAAAAGARVLIEPINAHDVPGYLLGTTAAALAFIADVDRPNVRLQFDCYHVQRGEGNVVGALRDCMRSVGHVQIADSPDRHEPGTGELRFDYILGELERLGYDGYVGLEYVPSARTEDSFGWLRR